MTIFQDLKERVVRLNGNEYLYFDSSLKIKTSPHAPEFSAWGVCVSPDHILYVMDFKQDWHIVDPRSTHLVAALYQRVVIMENLKQKKQSLKP